MMLESEKQQQPTDVANVVDVCVCASDFQIGLAQFLVSPNTSLYDIMAGYGQYIHTVYIYSEAPIKDTLGS